MFVSAIIRCDEWHFIYSDVDWTTKVEKNFTFIFCSYIVLLFCLFLFFFFFFSCVTLIWFFFFWMTMHILHETLWLREENNGKRIIPGKKHRKYIQLNYHCHYKCLCVDRIWLYVVVVSRFLLHNFGNDMRILVFRWNAWECMFRVSFRSISASSSSSSTVMHHLIRLLNFIPRFRGMEWY